MSLYDDEDLPGIAPIITAASSAAEISKPQASSELPASFKLLQTQLQAKKAALQQQTKPTVPAKRIALPGVPEIVSAWPARPAPQPKVEILVSVTTQSRLIEDSGEVRFNQRTGKMEAVRIELRSVTKADDDGEYDPFRPNDYEMIMRRKREQRRVEEEQREKEQAQRRREEAEQRELMPRRRNMSTSSSEDDAEKEEERKRKMAKAGGVAIAPPAALMEIDSQKDAGNEPDSPALGGGGAAAAARMMRRMGYKEGEGLGRSHQGIATALTVEKTGLRVGKILPGANEKAANIAAAINASIMQAQAQAQAQAQQSGVSTTPNSQPVLPDSPGNTNGAALKPAATTSLLRNPSRVVVLRNMVGPGDVDDQLEAEVSEECTKYGKVTRCLIFELKHVVAEEAVRIFVEFEKIEQATKALIDLNGRYFGGRLVRANFYDAARFGTYQLADPLAD